jgi:hypothetical protein
MVVFNSGWPVLAVVALFLAPQCCTVSWKRSKTATRHAHAPRAGLHLNLWPPPPLPPTVLRRCPARHPGERLQLRSVFVFRLLQDLPGWAVPGGLRALLCHLQEMPVS